MTPRIAVWGQFVAVCAAAHLLNAQQPPADTTRRDPPPATLIGRVIDSAGAGIPGAEITLLHSPRVHVISGDSGDFRIAGIPSGTEVFNVRRIGFQAATFTAVLHAGRTARTNFPLTATAHELPTVAVSDTAVQSHWLDQFDRRRGGSRGTFITRDEIVKSDARMATDIMRRVPGVRVDRNRWGGNQVVMTRGSGARQCYPAMFVHGVPYSGTLDDFVPDDIEALEVYVGISEIPPELDKNGKGICGAIVVWTRDPKKAP